MEFDYLWRLCTWEDACERVDALRKLLFDSPLFGQRPAENEREL